MIGAIIGDVVGSRFEYLLEIADGFTKKFTDKE